MLVFQLERGSCHEGTTLCGFGTEHCEQPQPPARRPQPRRPPHRPCRFQCSKTTGQRGAQWTADSNPLICHNALPLARQGWGGRTMAAPCSIVIAAVVAFTSRIPSRILAFSWRAWISRVFVRQIEIPAYSPALNYTHDGSHTLPLVVPEHVH